MTIFSDFIVILQVELFFKDFQHLNAPLGGRYLKIASEKQSYFDYFHFSPLKVHVLDFCKIYEIYVPNDACNSMRLV